MQMEIMRDRRMCDTRGEMALMSCHWNPPTPRYNPNDMRVEVKVASTNKRRNQERVFVEGFGKLPKHKGNSNKGSFIRKSCKP